jgi:hypothetical protein
MMGRLVLLLILSTALVRGQMLDPSLDRPDEPFCYFSQPTDVIGVMDGPEGTLVTPEGYLYTGFGELMFFTGNPPHALRQRVKTLERGYLPIINYGSVVDGIRYQVQMFAATLDGSPESPLVNFVRVRMLNTTGKTRRGSFGAAFRHDNEITTDWGFGDHRFPRPAASEYSGGYRQSGVEFNKESEYLFAEDAFLRDGKVCYLFSSTPAPIRMITVNSGGNDPPNIGPQKVPGAPSTPVGFVQYDSLLAAGDSVELVLKMPYEPVASHHPLVAALRQAAYDEYYTRTVIFWEEIIARGLAIAVPEEKVVNTFKANLVFTLIARNKEDGYAIQKVNEFQYDTFWLRDAAFIVRMYDLSGYHDIARECLAFFPRWQQPDGNFISQGGQYDGWGQTMWAYGQHYRMTNDRAFAASIFPSMQKAFGWLQKVRRDDPFHLIPKTTPGDNEDISGHVTGHNFWALIGLKNMIAVAQGLGRHDDARLFGDEYDDLHKALRLRLQAMSQLSGGFIPPGLDTLGGNDWGNMLSVYPEMILDPHDPLVTATLQMTRAKYQEGIMTYGNGRWLHHYLTMKNTETEVIRGDQKTALEEFYALLLHTSATHTGFEFFILPWGTRDFGMNLAPHGWFSAKFRALLRNMLVREQHSTLHLFSCISPEWVGEGKSISLQRAPTYFGSVGAEFHSTGNGATIALQHSWTRRPDSLIIHLPWFARVSSATVDGNAVAFDKGWISCAADARTVKLSWALAPGSGGISYEKAVVNYTDEYRRRYDQWISGGKQTTTR